jgi:hypothetical protein
MRSPDKLDRSSSSCPSRGATVHRRRRSAGESQMAVTAIDHGGRVVTVTSQLAETASSADTPQSPTFTTSVHGGPLNASMWRASSWSASLQNHAAAVNQVVKLIASNVDAADQLARK